MLAPKMCHHSQFHDDRCRADHRVPIIASDVPICRRAFEPLCDALSVPEGRVAHHRLMHAQCPGSASGSDASGHGSSAEARLTSPAVDSTSSSSVGSAVSVLRATSSGGAVESRDNSLRGQHGCDAAAARFDGASGEPARRRSVREAVRHIQ